MYLALRDIRFAKGRFALMGSVVALISLLLVMLSGLTAGLANQSTSSIKGLDATQIAFGAPDGTDPEAFYTDSQVNQDALANWRAANGVTHAGALGITQSRLQSDGSVNQSDGSANVAVFGAEASGPLGPQQLDGSEAVLSREVADDLGLQKGDDIGIGGVELTVGGIIATQWYSHTPVVWTSLADWQELSRLTDPDVIGTIIAATYNEDAANATPLADINAAAGTVSTTTSGSLSALASFQSENGSLTLMQGFLYGISALVIVAFLTVWTVQRTRDIAVLKALGGSNAYVLKDAMAQASIVLVAGAAVGGGLGLVGGYFAAQAAPFITTTATTLVPIAGIVLLGMAGSVLAVRRVAKIDPLIALGGN